jgi:hypothetical protein
MTATDARNKRRALEAVFPVLSVPRLYTKGQLPLKESHQKAVRRVRRFRARWLPSWDFGSWKPVQLGSCSERGDSQRGLETVNVEVEGSTALKAVTGKRLVKTQQPETTEYVL